MAKGGKKKPVTKVVTDKEMLGDKVRIGATKMVRDRIASNDSVIINKGGPVTLGVIGAVRILQN
jgi:hypothetical protein